jgi:hypothetical protein
VLGLQGVRGFHRLLVARAVRVVAGARALSTDFRGSDRSKEF